MSILPAADPASPAPVLPLIVLLTDYGTEDWFVGVMKGVIKGICPEAEIVDLCHHIAPHSIAQGNLMLSAAHSYFPAGTIFVAVVDPGVGTAREPVLVRAAGQWFLAPNNGILNFLLTNSPLSEAEEQFDCRILSNANYHLPSPSDTFHGRDIFAPCAAHLASGVPYTQIAPQRTTLYGMPTTTASVDRGVIEGNIIHFDHFGNALTNISRDLLREFQQTAGPSLDACQIRGEALIVEVSGAEISGISRTYADAEPGTPVAYWGSTGHLEIAVNRGSAREQLHLHLLDKVTVRGSDGAA